MLSFGLIVTFALVFGMIRQEQHSEHGNFERRAQFRVAAVQQGVSNAIDALQVVNQAFVMSGNVSREQFHTFTQPLRARYPYIGIFSYRRLVSRDQRAAFEASMGARYPAHAIGEMIDGKRVVAAVKERYQVIDYIEPMAGNEAAVGIDTSSQAFQADAVRRAEDTGLPAATGGLLRTFNDRRALSFRILMAVYKNGAALDDVAARRRAVDGYTVATLHAGELFEKILASAGSLGNADLDIRVYAGPADERKLVYGQAGAAAPSAWLDQPPDTYAGNIDVAGTTWQMRIASRPAPFVRRHAGALFALLAGLLSTFAAAGYVQAIQLRAQRTEQLVARRTEKLRQVNGLLAADIKARKQVEQTLQDSEIRLRELADLSSDWFWEQDEHFRFTSLSTGVMGEGGDPLTASILGNTRWELPVDLQASDWPALHAMLKARQPFRNFEFKSLLDGTPVHWVSASGKPLFDAQGQFKGYRGTCRNISVRKAAEEALRHSRSELRSLAGHQESVREDERKRIARDIHDDLGQNLMALRIDMSMLAAQADARPVGKEQIVAAVSQLDTSIKAVRAIINDLRPAVLDFGLHAALEWQATEFERRSGIACELHLGPEEFALDDRRATALFRIVQEALANILRHAKATQVRIGMQRRDGRLLLEIADDGVGLAPDCRHKVNAFGLVGIEERILALGGTFSMASNPGAGLALTLTIPIEAGATPGAPPAGQA